MGKVEISYCNESHFMTNVLINISNVKYINNLRLTTEQSFDILCIYSTVLFVVTFVGNAMFIVTVWKSYQLHSTAYYYVSSLAVVDTLVAMIYMIKCLSDKFMPLHTFLETLTCKTLGILANYLVKVEFLTIALVTLERYFMICYPYTHQEKLMLRFPGFFIAALWSLGFIVYMFPILIEPGYIYNACILKCIPSWVGNGDSVFEFVPIVILMLILPFCYIRIGIAVYRANKHINATMVTPQPDGPTMNRQGTKTDDTQTDDNKVNIVGGNIVTDTDQMDLNNGSQGKQTNSKSRKSAGSKGIKVIVLITVIYFILWFVPIFCVVVARNAELAIFGDAFYVLSTGTVLPIYGVFDTRFKACLRKTFGCHKGHVAAP